MSGVVQGVDYLTDPLPLVLPLAEVRAEETPVWDLTLLTEAGGRFIMQSLGLRSYWAEGPGAKAIEWSGPRYPEWFQGAIVICANCSRVIKARRDWCPVRHKVDGDWCAGNDVPGFPDG